MYIGRLWADENKSHFIYWDQKTGEVTESNESVSICIGYASTLEEAQQYCTTLD